MYSNMNKTLNIIFHDITCEGNSCCPVQTDGGLHDDTNGVFSKISFLLSLKG